VGCSSAGGRLKWTDQAPCEARPVLALATYDGAPLLPTDEAPFVQALSERGVLARPAVWTDDSVDWHSYAACVIRATWDYHVRRNDFLGWARRVETACQLWNPLPMLEWNSHKAYLLSLGRSGVPVVPTVLVQQGTRSILADIVNDRSWGEFIVKPAVGADAWQVARGRQGSLDVARAQLDRILADGDALVQPYFSSVEELGERSLIYVDGELTHGVRRPPVLAPAGGLQRHPELTPPSEEERSVAEAALKSIGRPVLYARVDLVRDNLGSPRLLELELIEPYLFFGLAPHAAERLAEAIARRLQTSARAG
jgi:hypothetical protein